MRTGACIKAYFSQQNQSNWWFYDAQASNIACTGLYLLFAVYMAYNVVFVILSSVSLVFSHHACPCHTNSWPFPAWFLVKSFSFPHARCNVCVCGFVSSFFTSCSTLFSVLFQWSFKLVFFFISWASLLHSHSSKQVDCCNHVCNEKTVSSPAFHQWIRMQSKSVIDSDKGENT